jgi:hypothetical protein
MEQSSVEIRVKENGSTTKHTLYYYKHYQRPCYYCCVSKNYVKQNIKTAPDAQKRLNALRAALGRERNIMHNNEYNNEQIVP